MATLTTVNIDATDTGTPALTQDDGANILKQVLSVLSQRTLSIAYKVGDPEVTITVS